MIPHMTSPTTQATSGAIRAEVARRRLNQRELAEQLGMSQSALSRRMAGEQTWDLDELDRIAQLFEMDVRDLLPASVTP